MDSYIVGIDFGATSSCICIPAREGKGSDGPIELIPDELGRLFTPSVVSEGVEGRIIVGHYAKQSTGLLSKLILFIKRYLGTDHTEVLCGRAMTPEEISAEILKHLKRISEYYLGALVSKAVICVPAWFDFSQRKATKKAAELAGLQVMDLLMEPVAAALGYGLQDYRDGLKIFCYDLGASFNATLMHKEAGTIKILAVGGDPYLGGCEFDRLLADYILQELRITGQYDLDLNPYNEADAAKYRALLHIAEEYKIRMTDAPEIAIRERGIFADQQGLSVNIEMSIRREEFEALIRDSVMRTFDLSKDAINKSGLVPEEIDEIIIVGGSSRIPIVRRELMNLFGKEPKQIDPDTLVAKGAAIHAIAYMEKRNLGLELTNIPEVALLPLLSISGSIDATQFDVPLTQLRVSLVRRDQGYESEIAPNPIDGSFTFNEVELYQGVENFFRLSVLTGEHSLVLTHDFSVIHSEDAGDAADLSPMRADFQNQELRSIEELRGESEDLKDRFFEVLESAEAEKRLMFNKKGRRIIEDIEAEFQSAPPVLPKIVPMLLELQAMIRDLKKKIIFEPTEDEFRESLQNARSWDVNKKRTDEINTLEQVGVKALEKKDLPTWKEANSNLDKILRVLAKELVERDKQLQEMLSDPEEMAPRRKESLLNDVRVLSEKAEARGVQKTYTNDVKKLEEEIQKVDVTSDSAKAIMELQRIKENAYKPLYEKITSGDRKDKGGKDCEPSERELAQSGNICKACGHVNDIRCSRCTACGQAMTLAENSSVRALVEPRRAEVPTSRIDKVHFSVVSPPSIQPGQRFIIDLWAHLERQRTEVVRRIQQAIPQTDSPPVIRPKGPFKIERGTMLFVSLKFDEFSIEPPEDVILWEGEIGNASFMVSVPTEIAEGTKVGLATVHWEGGLQIARVQLQIHVAAKVHPTTPTAHSLRHIQKAFASYASADRYDVLASIQGMQKIAPGLKVFYDEANLRSGSNWEQELKRVIPENDILYLFWSASAKASRWVEMEWRCALKSRGIDFIDPVPLVSPEEVPPPEELSGKHFKDWVLAYRRKRPKAD